MWTARSRLFSTGFVPKPPSRFPGGKLTGLLALPLILYGAYTRKDEVIEYYNTALGRKQPEKVINEPVRGNRPSVFVQDDANTKRLKGIIDGFQAEIDQEGKPKDVADALKVEKGFGVKHLGHDDVVGKINENSSSVKEEKEKEKEEEKQREGVKVDEVKTGSIEESKVHEEEKANDQDKGNLVVEEAQKLSQETPLLSPKTTDLNQEPVVLAQDTAPINNVTNNETKPEISENVLPGFTSENIDKLVEATQKLAEEFSKLAEESTSLPLPSEIPKPSDSSTNENSQTESLKPDLSSKDLELIIQQLRSEMAQDQQKRENELYSGIEDLFKTLISEYIPKSDSQHSPARVISSHIDFSRLSSNQVQEKFEDLINAYQNRLETLGVRNYDSFIERLNLQKDKWKLKIKEIQTEHEKQVAEEINARDEQWKKVLYEEAADSEKHYETQTKIDSDFVRQETELDLSKKFKEELDSLTQTLDRATKERMGQLEEILQKIKEMEKIQADHYDIIVKLTKVHKLHVAIENMQRALLADKGNLTNDLKVVISESKSSPAIQKSLETLEPVYSQIIRDGIPKLKQIQEKFEKSSQNARRSALVTSGSFANILLSRVAIHFIPANIRTVDDSDTFSYLKNAEDALTRGDLKTANESLKQLKGLPAEEVKELLTDIEIRLAFSELVELLSANSISTVQQMINAKVLY